MPESSKVLSKHAVWRRAGAYQNRIENVGRKRKSTLRPTHASAVAIIIPEIPHRYPEINVLACEIRRTIEKN